MASIPLPDSAESGSHFDETLLLKDGCPVGSGPLEYDASTMHIWIIQPTTAGNALAEGGGARLPKGQTWEIPTTRVEGSAAFEAGSSAYATAVAFVVDDSKAQVVQWSMPVMLSAAAAGA